MVPLTFQAGSNYNVRITPTANDKTVITGATTINGGTVVAGRGTAGAVTGGHVGAYAVKTYAGFYGLASLAGSFYGDTETRMVAGFGGLGGETERGTTAARAIRARLEAGRPVDDIAGMTLTPSSRSKSQASTPTALPRPRSRAPASSRSM